MAFKKTQPKPKPKGYSVNPGDLVKFTRGDTILQGEVDLIRDQGRTEPGIWVSMKPIFLDRLFRDGYEAEVVKPAEHTLPEKTGVYITENHNLVLQLVDRYFADELAWKFMGRDDIIKHRELPYTYLPLTLIKELG